MTLKLDGGCYCKQARSVGLPGKRGLVMTTGDQTPALPRHAHSVFTTAR